MADTKIGNYSQSSSASANAPVVNTNNSEGGFLSSTMDFFNKNKIIIIGIIVLIIVGVIAYKYFGTERFTGASKKSIRGKKNKVLTHKSDEDSEHFSASQEEQEEEQEQEEVTEEFDGAEEEFDGAEEFEGAEEIAEQFEIDMNENDQDGGDYQEDEYADEE
jgi:hypothetical protein